MQRFAFAALACSQAASAFPWVAGVPGVDTGLFRRQQTDPNLPASAKNCPNNPNHVPAVPVNARFPYNNATNGQQGNGKGGYLVPHPNDPDHQFIAPNPKTDIRGPCPGLNTAANYGFLARDGVVTYNELVDAQQNVYNVGWDLANLLAVLGLTTTDGDPVTEKLSIGCDATTRTSFNPTLTGSEPGLDGHNKFEADSSLTRNDYFTHGGDDFTFNATLFKMMTDTTGGNYNLQNLALYRYQRYQQSVAENPNFYFGPLALLLYGAASFLYTLFPSSNNNNAPDYATISSFFGAGKNADGSYYYTGQEKIPANWTTRVSPLSMFGTGEQIFLMYGLYPVPFGGNTGNGQFNFISYGSNGSGIDNGRLAAGSGTDIMCLLYMAATDRVPTSLNGILTPTANAISFALGKLNPIYENFGCPFALT